MGDERERDEDGKYTPKHSDEDIIQAVKRLEPASTQEVADELGVARQSADYRLRQLSKADLIQKQKIGNSLAWSVME